MLPRLIGPAIYSARLSRSPRHRVGIRLTWLVCVSPSACRQNSSGLRAILHSPELHALASDLIFRMHRGSPLFLLAGLFLARLLSSGTHIIHQTWPATTCFLGRSLGRSFLTWRKLLRFLASFFPRVSLLPGWFTCHCILQFLDCRFQTMFHAAVAILLRESAALLSSRSVNKLAKCGVALQRQHCPHVP